MTRRVLLDTAQTQPRLCVLEDDVPVEFAVPKKTDQPAIGSLFAGVVQQLRPGLSAAFVDIGIGRNGFLPFVDCPLGYKPRGGDTLLVQIVKDQGPPKGPRVTAKLSIPGRFTVLLPHDTSAGVSRHLEENRDALCAMAQSLKPDGMGIILRTAALGVPLSALQEDIEEALALYRTLQNQALHHKPPVCLLNENDLERAIPRDLGVPLETALFSPEIEGAWQTAERRRMRLPSGGSLVFDRTEALVVIDVNSGSDIHGKNVGELALRVNCEAALEIARQTRLRDLFGIMVIDFVDLDTDDQRETVFETLENAMKADRGRHHLHGFTSAGLFELTRRAVWRTFGEGGSSHGDA